MSRGRCCTAIRRCRATIPMRGNEERIVRGRGVSSRPATIPMGGNESRYIARALTSTSAATIPMRGNEVGGLIRGLGLKFGGYDPHEG